MYKNKKTLLIGLSQKDYNSLKSIAEKRNVSIVEAVRFSIRAYNCLSLTEASKIASSSDSCLRSLVNELNFVRRELEELINV